METGGLGRRLRRTARSARSLATTKAGAQRGVGFIPKMGVAQCAETAQHRSTHLAAQKHGNTDTRTLCQLFTIPVESVCGEKYVSFQPPHYCTSSCIRERSCSRTKKTITPPPQPSHGRPGTGACLPSGNTKPSPPLCLIYMLISMQPFGSRPLFYSLLLLYIPCTYRQRKRITCGSLYRLCPQDNPTRDFQIHSIYH